MDAPSNSMREWLEVKRNAAEGKTYKRPLQTGGYQTIRHQYWQQPRDLPPFSFAMIYFMLMDPQIRLCLNIRSAPLFGAEFAWKKSDPMSPSGYKWIPGIQARRPEVAKYVERQLTKIWHNHLADIVDAQTWGWSAGEVCLKLGASRMVEVSRIEPRKAEDVRLLMTGGVPSGVEFSRINNNRSGNKINLGFPDCFFHSHGKQPGEDYGTSVLLGAYSPWADKWLDGGALDVRRLFMLKDAYSGADLGYPEGHTFLDGMDDPVPNRDLARQIVEQIRSGGVTTRPSERDERGNEKWPLTRATVSGNPAHILQYPKDCDDEIRQGIGIPDGVIDDTGAGAWAGKRIPMSAFYASLDTWIIQIINDLTEQILERLVLLNFGKAEDFQITHKPLAEQAMEQQSNAGGGQPEAQQQQPGGIPGMPQMPGQGGPGANLYGVNNDSGQAQGPQPARMGLEAIGEGVLSAAEMVKAARDVIRMSVESDEIDPDEAREQATLIAEILTHIYGDEAEDKFDEIFGDAPAQRMASWNPIDHPRGPDGRFIEKNSPEAVAAARDNIKQALAGKRTAKSLEAVTQNLSILTVKQLRDIKQEYNIAAGGVKSSLVNKIADRLHGVALVDDDDDQAEPEATGSDARPSARGDGTPKEPSNRDVYTVPTNSLKIDPKRFQYKVKGIGEKGVGDELKGTSVWNPELGGVLLVWRDPDDGNDYVINGHHRHELASRTGATELNVRYIDAESAKIARSRGALANIAEGRGTAIDAAKYLRDVGADVDHLKRAGISMSGKVAADASVLVDLADKPFQALAEGLIEESTAVAVARHLKDHDLQNKLFKRIADREEDGKEWTIRETETAAKKMANAGKYTERGADLFGDFEEEHSTFDQEVEIESFISRQLAQEANDFRAVASSRRAERVADAGNVLAIDENARRADLAAIAADTFDREANLKGPVSAAIKEHAAEYAQAKTRKERREIKAAALESVRAAIAEIESPDGPAADPAGPDPGATAAADDGPQEGDRNADGLVFHDGRWHREDADQAAPKTAADFDSVNGGSAEQSIERALSFEEFDEADARLLLDLIPNAQHAALAAYVASQRPDAADAMAAAVENAQAEAEELELALADESEPDPEPPKKKKAHEKTQWEFIESHPDYDRWERLSRSDGTGQLDGMKLHRKMISQHREKVAAAIAAGKAVSDEVLADYEGLRDKVEARNTEPDPEAEPPADDTAPLSPVPGELMAKVGQLRRDDKRPGPGARDEAAELVADIGKKFNDAIRAQSDELGMEHVLNWKGQKFLSHPITTHYRGRILGIRRTGEPHPTPTNDDVAKMVERSIDEMASAYNRFQQEAEEFRGRQSDPEPIETAPTDPAADDVQRGMFGDDFKPGRFDDSEMRDLTGKQRAVQDRERQNRMFDYLDDDPGQGVLFAGDGMDDGRAEYERDKRAAEEDERQAKAKAEARRSQASGPADTRPAWQVPRNEYIDRPNDSGLPIQDYQAIQRAAHVKAVQRAVEAGEDVPREVLEPYRANGWAKQALAKIKGPDGKPGHWPSDLNYVRPTAPGVSHSDIPYSLATQAHYGTSMVPERRGFQEQNDYVTTMNNAWAQIQKMGDDPEAQREQFDEFKARFTPKFRDYLNSKSRVVSAMIAGPSNFPTRRNQKRGDAADNKAREMMDFEERALRAIRRKLAPEDTGIASGDPDAIENLQKKLEKMEAQQARFKAINAAHRRFKKDPASLDRSDLDEATKKMIRNYVPQYSWEPSPIAPYQMTNNNANIKRIRDRIQQVERLQASTPMEASYSGGVTVSEDRGDNRIRISFPGKPEAATIRKLKSRGFRWSPRNKAWQRQITDNARYATENLLSELGLEKE